MSKITFIADSDLSSDSKKLLIEKKIKKFEPELLEKLKKYYDFLQGEKNHVNSIEIHWPIFELGLTFMMSLIGEKFQISVLDHMDSKIFGNVLVDGYECLHPDDLKNLATWNKFSRNKLSILKPLK